MLQHTSMRQASTSAATAALLCQTLQHTATHCNTLQHTATYCNTLQHTAIHCNTLPHTETHYHALHHTTTHCHTLKHTQTHSNTLQRTNTHCTTLHHTSMRQVSTSSAAAAALLCHSLASVSTSRNLDVISTTSRLPSSTPVYMSRTHVTNSYHELNLATCVLLCVVKLMNEFRSRTHV